MIVNVAEITMEIKRLQLILDQAKFAERMSDEKQQLEDFENNVKGRVFYNIDQTYDGRPYVCLMRPVSVAEPSAYHQCCNTVESYFDLEGGAIKYHRKEKVVSRMDLFGDHYKLLTDDKWSEIKTKVISGFDKLMDAYKPYHGEEKKS